MHTLLQPHLTQSYLIQSYTHFFSATLSLLRESSPLTTFSLFSFDQCLFHFAHFRSFIARICQEVGYHDQKKQTNNLMNNIQRRVRTTVTFDHRLPQLQSHSLSCDAKRSYHLIKTLGVELPMLVPPSPLAGSYAEQLCS